MKNYRLKNKIGQYIQTLPIVGGPGLWGPGSGHLFTLKEAEAEVERRGDLGVYCEFERKAA